MSDLFITMVICFSLLAAIGMICVAIHMFMIREKQLAHAHAKDSLEHNRAIAELEHFERQKQREDVERLRALENGRLHVPVVLRDTRSQGGNRRLVDRIYDAKDALLDR